MLKAIRGLSACSRRRRPSRSRRVVRKRIALEPTGYCPRRPDPPTMDESTRGTLGFVAVQLAAVYAGLHFYWAFPKLVRTVQYGQPLYRDPRPLLFVGLTVLVLGGLVLVQQGAIPRTAAYV